MTFGRKATKNNWLTKNSLFPTRRRSRKPVKTVDFSITRGEESKNPIKQWVTSQLQYFTAKGGTITTSKAENQEKSVFYRPRKSYDQSLNSDSSQMGNSGIFPLWLIKLYQVNRYSSILTFILVSCTLTAYSLTVYSQQLWSGSYKRLRDLQRHERQLNTANATLTSKIAEDGAKPKTGMVTANPDSAIFVNPSLESGRSTKPSQSNQTESKMEGKSSTPMGY